MSRKADVSRKDGERMNFAKPEMRKELIDLFAQEASRWGYLGTSLTKDSWTRVIQAIKAKYNIELEQKQLKNQWDYLRKQFQTWKILENRTGHGYNAENGTFDWPNDVWEDIIKKYPETKKYRNKPLEDRELLRSLFDSTLAKGNNAFSPTHEIPKENPRNQSALEDDEEIFDEEITNALHHANQSDSYFTDYSFYEEPAPINIQEQAGQSDAGSSRAKKRRKTSEPVEDPMVKDFHDLVGIIRNDHGTKDKTIGECSKILRELKDLGKLDNNTFIKAMLAFSNKEDHMSFFLNLEGYDEKVDFIKGMLERV